MGTWGNGLYSNDLAQDLRDDFAHVVRAPWNGDALRAWAASRYPALEEPGDDEYPDVQLVLADLFWRFGIEHQPTVGAALEVIDSGRDLAVKRSLGMTERDLRRRAAVLRDLGQRLAAPNPRPRSRHVLRRPERFILDTGDCLTYPTDHGKLRNPYVTPAREAAFFARHKWSPDGWGAAIVLDRRHEYTVFARYLVAVLGPTFARRPGPDDLAQSSITHTEMPLGPSWPQSDKSRRAVHWISLTTRHRDRMRIDVIGRLRLDAELVERDLAGAVSMRSLDHSLANVAHFGAIGNRVVGAVDPIARYLLPSA